MTLLSSVKLIATELALVIRRKLAEESGRCLCISTRCELEAVKRLQYVKATLSPSFQHLRRCKQP